MNKKINFGLLVLIFVLGVFLRFYKITENPPGLYIDEVAIGVDAYSILKSGKDQNGAVLPLWFKSYGDYKMPIYIYAAAGSMAIFGKNEFAIRFPSAAAGSLTVIVFYFFLKELLGLTDKKFRQKCSYLPLLSAFLLSISSWHIQFSRGGLEVNFALFLFLLALWLSLSYWKKKQFVFLFISFLLFAATIYTYHSFRIIAPITLVSISILVFRHKKNLLHLIITCLLTVVVLIPIIWFSFTPEGSDRFSATSAFSEYTADNSIQKLLIYPVVYIKNYFTFFSLDFLFNFGDGIGRHQIPDFGVLFRWELPFFLVGLYELIRKKKTAFTSVIIFLLLVAPIPAALARPSPHTLRALLMVIPLTVIISTGMISVWESIKKFRKLLFLFFILVLIYEFSFYLHFYYIHYPNVNSLDWGGGFKSITQKAAKYSSQKYKIVIDNNLVDSKMYFKFYSPQVKAIYVDVTWIKPKAWEKVIYIRPYYGPQNNQDIIDTVYRSNLNRDIFAQFYKL